VGSQRAGPGYRSCARSALEVATDEIGGMADAATGFTEPDRPLGPGLASPIGRIAAGLMGV
jgi:hypothetical protein